MYQNIMDSAIMRNKSWKGETANMNRDSYEDFAARYDLFFDKFGEHNPVRFDFFHKLFTEKQVHSVLDCACGTGQDLHLFHSLRCEVFGSDISEAMLTQALLAFSKINADESPYLQ